MLLEVYKLILIFIWKSKSYLQSQYNIDNKNKSNRKCWERGIKIDEWNKVQKSTPREPLIFDIGAKAIQWKTGLGFFKNGCQDICMYLYKTNKETLEAYLALNTKVN